MADNSVRADTPDPTKYFPNRGGMPGTMIPRAGHDGQSLGFDHNRPQKVIVDPGEAGGGFELDVAALSRHKQTFNAAAVKASVAGDVTSFYREISQRMDEPDPKPPTPKGKPMTETLKPIDALPPLPSVASLTQNAADEVESQIELQAQKAAELKRQYFGTPQLTASDPLVHQQMTQQSQLINALIERVNILSTPPAEKAAEPPVSATSLEQSLTEAFAGLQIPFLLGEKAVRPDYETYFEMAKLGTMAARYHAVVPGQSCLALIYDTRFVDGFQYLPPNLGDERIAVSVPKLKQNFSCSSLGLHWSLGCLDVVILILHNGAEA
jgi:hypothetical protein